MNANNKKRLLQVIKILQKETDMDHPMSLKQLVSRLEESGINIQNRKTIYDDIKVINDFGYEVEYNNGYYLMEAPFSLSEIKIIIDSINSLKNLDTSFLISLKKKLYSFISNNDEKTLKDLEYHNKHSDKKFIHRLEDTLDAIKTNKSLIIVRINKNIEEEIIPLFIHRHNDYYYLYYHYLNNENIYHTRFDNINKMKQSNSSDSINIPKDNILKTINESSNSFYSNKSELINFLISNDSEYLRSRLLDDFPNIIFTNNGFSLKASINDAFFCKLVTYSDDIKINDTKIAKEYNNFLEKIIIHNKD